MSNFVSKSPGYEIFFVAALRQEGSLPSIVKALYDRIFFSVEDAEEFRKNQSDPEIFGVYSASVTVNYQIKSESGIA